MTEKENFIKSFNEAFAKNDSDFILASMSEKVVWDFIGDWRIEGKEAVKKALEEMCDVETLEMSILNIVTHGKSAAAHGTMKIKGPMGELKNFGFSDFYEFDGFKSPKIRKMTSYVVALKPKNSTSDEKQETKDRSQPVV